MTDGSLGPSRDDTRAACPRRQNSVFAKTPKEGLATTLGITAPECRSVALMNRRTAPLPALGNETTQGAMSVASSTRARLSTSAATAVGSPVYCSAEGSGLRVGSAAFWRSLSGDPCPRRHIGDRRLGALKCRCEGLSISQGSHRRRVGSRSRVLGRRLCRSRCRLLRLSAFQPSSRYSRSCRCRESRAPLADRCSGPRWRLAHLGPKLSPSSTQSFQSPSATRGVV